LFALCVQGEESIGFGTIGGDIATAFGATAVSEDDARDGTVAMAQFAKERGGGSWRGKDDSGDTMIVDDIEPAKRERLGVRKVGDSANLPSADAQEQDGESNEAEGDVAKLLPGMR